MPHRPIPAGQSGQSRTASGSIAFSAPYGSGALVPDALHYPYPNGVHEEAVAYGGLVQQSSHPILGVPPQAYRGPSAVQVQAMLMTAVHTPLPGQLHEESVVSWGLVQQSLHPMLRSAR